MQEYAVSPEAEEAEMVLVTRGHASGQSQTANVGGDHDAEPGKRGLAPVEPPDGQEIDDQQDSVVEQSHVVIVPIDWRGSSWPPDVWPSPPLRKRRFRPTMAASRRSLGKEFAWLGSPY